MSLFREVITSLWLLKNVLTKFFSQNYSHIKQSRQLNSCSLRSLLYKLMFWTTPTNLVTRLHTRIELEMLGGVRQVRGGCMQIAVIVMSQQGALLNG